MFKTNYQKKWFETYVGMPFIIKKKRTVQNKLTHWKHASHVRGIEELWNAQVVLTRPTAGTTFRLI